MIDGPIQELATKGVLGLLLVITLIALWWKDKRLGDEVQARIEDAKAHAKDSTASIERVMKMQEFTKASDERSARLLVEFDKLREREHEREIRDAERDQRDRERDERDRQRDMRDTGGAARWKGPPR